MPNELKHVSATIPDLQDSRPQIFTKTAKPSLPANWIAALFSKLQARYGLTWSRQWTTTELQTLAMQEWSERLGDLTGEQIKHGLDHWRDTWPPNVEQFRQACTGDSDDWQHQTAAYKTFPPALPKPKAKFETAAAALAAMRERPTLTPEQIEAELRRLQKTA